MFKRSLKALHVGQDLYTSLPRSGVYSTGLARAQRTGRLHVPSLSIAPQRGSEDYELADNAGEVPTAHQHRAGDHPDEESEGGSQAIFERRLI